MIVSSQKLNPNLFDDEIEQAPIRDGFGEGIVLIAREDERIVGLSADLTESTKMDAFRKEFPHRFIEMGVAEQNMASVASGLSAMGKVPFITSYAMFSPGRNWEQIRTTICYNDRKVVIAGSHAGISVGPDGGTHQAIEDIAITRVIPNMHVLVPCDKIEARKATIAATKTKTPTYIRLAREKTAIVTTESSPFAIGKANILRKPDNPKVTIIACGTLVHSAILSAAELSAKGIEAIVINMHTIKPLDHETILWAAKESGAIVTVEEHQKAGGMGSAVAESLAQRLPVSMEFVGIGDMFGQSGTPQELLLHYGLSVKDITFAAQKVITRIR
ncbi:MAG: transketolase [Candidatus Vogelbacteria bacterium CG10_big_fil_rev_8_21_14_0_10_45_14]|uniref:Transketolase n=1 Tax=Candidatus Vogelbacteria bacterium CG10_big_fil_rev_8_21_14_0_10_45_14 TaxID=1975042 RepID=A0A2H0RIL4_9BACT|nr:MAG: transketolase [Candidatus Vogelbacteria bacterium CG10_big_fil_rev_8_21_14_0_10_45_14]